MIAGYTFRNPRQRAKKALEARCIQKSSYISISWMPENEQIEEAPCGIGTMPYSQF